VLIDRRLERRCEEREPPMSAMLLVYLVVVLLMAKTLAGMYFGASYVCPSCGARREDQHSEECQWHR
jgi:hypothetical protein